MAQHRRFAGDHSHDNFWGRESVLEVGGTCLPETLQRRKMPRFSDTLDITGAMAADIQCGNHTRCNHSIHSTDNALHKPKKADNSCHNVGAQCDYDVCYTGYPFAGEFSKLGRPLSKLNYSR